MENMKLKLSWYELTSVKCPLHANHKDDSYRIYTKGKMGKEFKQFPTEKSTKHKTVMHEMSNKKGIGI